MNRYIEQLIEDLRKAAENAPHLNEIETNLTTDEEFARHIEDVERYLHGEQEKLSEIIGVPLKMLPSADKLNKHQLRILTQELIKLLNDWNFYPDFPDNLPDDMKYKALLDVWESDQVYMSSGETHLEFCDYDPENCPFPGYCKSCENRNDELEESADDYTSEMEDGWLLPDKNLIIKTLEQDDPTGENRFIPGIFNYCDRWCERCDFTDRCRNFVTLSQMEDELEAYTKEFEKGITELEEVEDHVAEATDELFDLDAENEDDPENREDFFSVYQKTERHPLSALSDEYSWAAHKWLLHHHSAFEKELTHWLARGQADEMVNAFDVLLWYHFFIHVKLKRAINGYYEVQDLDDSEYDMNGTAKVVLIAIDRSLDAFRILNRHLKPERDTILAFRNQLELIRAMTEDMFPEARSFIRPGLDE